MEKNYYLADYNMICNIVNMDKTYYNLAKSSTTV